MYSRAVIYSVFFNSFCQWNLSFMNTASVPTMNTEKYVGKSSSTYFVTTKSGFDGTEETEGCECGEFYKCKKEDLVPIPDEQGACPEPTQVCCYVSTSLIEDDVFGTSSEDSSFPETTTIPIPPCKNPGGIGLVDLRSFSNCGTNGGCCFDKESTLAPTPQFQCGERRSTTDLDIYVRGLVTEDSTNSSSTSFGEFPSMASIWARKDEFVCGASLISSNMLLTAAHCVNNRDYNTLSVRAGDYNIRAETSEEAAPHQQQTVSHIIVHPNFVSRTLKNDLAIIVTTESFKLDYHIFPVCTVAYGSEYADLKYNESACVATGWGKSSVESKEPLSATLKKVDLGVVPFLRCQETLRKTQQLSGDFKLDSSFLCAGGIKGVDMCTKDGGGPLVCPLLSNPRQYVQIGVTSWGIGCGSDTPGVYASLKPSNDWISSVYNEYKTSEFTSQITVKKN